ncbi:hypothetical protein BC938DRAFT_475328 [Jimgerdemannia flammicorona]|uniref:Uncharacterized protein n=1 Tax=Jimgerdemannia flammicorona TaxID=994334 RepID=A0A433QRS8_9FUNG|nr:hypothetical protein BC938DRAFT_475328 [Jimgerdemannia flammicorona]
MSTPPREASALLMSREPAYSTATQIPPFYSTAIKLSTKMTKQVPRGMSLYQAWIVDDASGRRYRRGREDGARCGDGGRAGELRSKVEETIKQLGDEEEKHTTQRANMAYRASALGLHYHLLIGYARIFQFENYKHMRMIVVAWSSDKFLR